MMSDSIEPRTYRVEVHARRGLTFIGIAPALMCFPVQALRMIGVLNGSVGIGDLIAALAMVAFACVVAASAHRRVILHSNAIEVIGWFSRRKLMREDIRGYRMGQVAWQEGGASYYIIVPLDEHSSELKLPPWLAYDKPFFSWMKTLPRFHGQVSS